MTDSPIDTAAQTMKVPWDKADTDYLDTRDVAVTDLLAIQPLTLTPDGPVRYMQGGRWQRVHLDDLVAYSMGEKPVKPVEKPSGPQPSPPEPKPPDKPKPASDDLLSCPNLLEVARRAYRCAGQARKNNGPGPAKEMLYRMYTRLGDAAYVCQLGKPPVSTGPLPLDALPNLSGATNAAQDAVQFSADDLKNLLAALKTEGQRRGLDIAKHELWVIVMAVLAVS